jgi:hypothetical protein
MKSQQPNPNGIDARPVGRWAFGVGRVAWGPVDLRNRLRNTKYEIRNTKGGGEARGGEITKTKLQTTTKLQITNSKTGERRSRAPLLFVI